MVGHPVQQCSQSKSATPGDGRPDDTDGGAVDGLMRSIPGGTAGAVPMQPRPSDNHRFPTAPLSVSLLYLVVNSQPSRRTARVRWFGTVPVRDTASAGFGSARTRPGRHHRRQRRPTPCPTTHHQGWGRVMSLVHIDQYHSPRGGCLTHRLNPFVNDSGVSRLYPLTTRGASHSPHGGCVFGSTHREDATPISEWVYTAVV